MTYNMYPYTPNPHDTAPFTVRAMPHELERWDMAGSEEDKRDIAQLAAANRVVPDTSLSTEELRTAANPPQFAGTMAVQESFTVRG